MEDIIYISSLFDLYKELFTTIQQNYFIDYYFNNLTLSEMSENYNVSRNAIHKNIKDTVKKLYDYENKIKMFEKTNLIKEIVKDNDILLKKILDVL